MGDSIRPDEHEFTIAMRELDAAKASVRNRRLELLNVIHVLNDHRPSPVELLSLEERSRAMNEASGLYIRAVGAFTAACLEERTTKIRGAAEGFFATGSR